MSKCDRVASLSTSVRSRSHGGHGGKFGLLLRGWVVLVALLASGALAQTAGSPFAGRWGGQWSDQRNGQAGLLVVEIRPDGSMTGIISNTALASAPVTGEWNGRIDSGGEVVAEYRYTTPPFESPPASAQGTWQIEPDGRLRGRARWILNGQVLGEGLFELKREQEIAAAAGAATPAPRGNVPAPGSRSPAPGGDQSARQPRPQSAALHAEDRQLATLALQAALARQGQIHPEDVTTFGLLLFHLRMGAPPPMAVIDGALAKIASTTALPSHRVNGYRAFWMSHLTGIDWQRFPMDAGRLLGQFQAYLDNKFEARQNRINQRLAAVVGSEEAWHKAMSSWRTWETQWRTREQASQAEYDAWAAENYAKSVMAAAEAAVQSAGAVLADPPSLPSGGYVPW